MSDIKSTIALLCKLLRLLYDCDMKNEHFRLAKFNSNKEDTVSNFWHLLHKICKDENKLKVFNGVCVVNYVKLSLALLKYDSIYFYSLPPDMSSGSRELLLAFSWLVTTQDILEKATRKKIMMSSISKEFGCPEFSNIDEKSHDMNISLKSLRNAGDCILWIAGKIRHNLKAIDELSQEWMNIAMKIHYKTQNVCGLPHLSTADAKMIYDKKDSSLGLEHMKKSVVIIETNSSWFKKSNIYWEWMETVVAERDKDPSQTFGIEARHILLSFIMVLERIIEAIIHEQKSDLSHCIVNGNNHEQNSVEEAENFTGIPRYILKKGTEETELKKLLNCSSVQITQLEKEYNIHLKDVKCFLDSFRNKMKDITVLHI